MGLADRLKQFLLHLESYPHPGSGSDRTTASVRQVTALAMLYIGRLVTCDINKLIFLTRKNTAYACFGYRR